MKISVLIPTYNSSATIRSTLDSVLNQTVTPDEVLILDDGSTDDTMAIVRSYEPRVTVRQQSNKGVANARNALSALATGDLLAFIDHDDIWHRSYLEFQRALFVKHPDACAFFTAHVNFVGHGNYVWDEKTRTHSLANLNVEVMDSLTFLKRYNDQTGPFGSMSYCCVPKRTLIEIGGEAFKLSGVDDSYLCTSISLLARPVIFMAEPLVAYRITEGALSTNKLKAFSLWVEVFRILEPRFRKIGERNLLKAFESAFASKRRSYAKLLMGSGEKAEARQQLKESLRNSRDPISQFKSLALLSLTHMPSLLQPRWPSKYRSQSA